MEGASPAAAAPAPPAAAPALAAPAPTGASSDAGPRRDWPVYTLAQVALHDRKDDAWIVVNDAVYDMTAHVRRRKIAPAPPRPAPMTSQNQWQFTVDSR